MTTDIRGASNAKAGRELAWNAAHPSWREGFRGIDERLDVGQAHRLAVTEVWLVTVSITSGTAEASMSELSSVSVGPQNVRFDDLAKVCAAHFGEPRQDGTSHKVYKTSWQGDPRVNIQRGKDGNAKAYQVGKCSTQSPSWKPRRTRRVTTMPDATHYTYRVAWSVEDASMSLPSRSSRHCPGSRPPRLKHSRVSPMSCVTCSPTWLHPASRFPSRCRNAPIRAGSWCVFRQRFTAALPATLPNSM